MENEIINIDIADTKKEEVERDLLFRQSKLLYPEVEDWVLNIAIEAYQNELKKQKEPNEDIDTKPSGRTDAL